MTRILAAVATYFFFYFFLNVPPYLEQTKRMWASLHSMEWNKRKANESHLSLLSPSTLPRTDVCFVTFEFAVNGQFLEPVQNLTKIGIRLNSDDFKYRYIVFTNDDSLDAQDWEKYVLKLDTNKYTKLKTHVSYAKFMAWKEPITASCRVIFSFDGLYVPVNKKDVWDELEKRIHISPGGLVTQPKPMKRTVIELVSMLPDLKKDTGKSARATHDWLLSQPNFDRNTPCLWTNFFGYDPTNALYRAASEDFWSLYSTEMLTPRDQPLWSFMVDKWKLLPNLLQTVEPDEMERKPHIHICHEVRRQQCEADLKAGKRTKPCQERFFEHNLDFDTAAVNCTAKKAHHFTGTLKFDSLSTNR